METPLRRIRRDRGLTLRQVAEAVGIDTGNLSRVETGKQRSPEIAERLAKYYGGDAISEIEILYPERFVQERAA